MSFRQFVRTITIGQWSNKQDIHWASQVLCFPNNIIDFVGRFENFQTDFDVVCDKIGVSRLKLSYANSYKHLHYTKYYDNKTRQLVAKRYKRDIETFGYEFGK